MVVTLLAIYCQRVVQQSLKEVQQLDDLSREWESERLLRCRRIIAITLQEGGDLEASAAALRMGDWEKLGSLVRAGLANQMLRTGKTIPIT